MAKDTVDGMELLGKVLEQTDGDVLKRLLLRTLSQVMDAEVSQRSGARPAVRGAHEPA